MIFKEGIYAQDILYHFGFRVSHVSQYWQDVSMATGTPKLCTNIRCIRQDGELPYPENLTESFHFPLHNKTIASKHLYQRPP